MSGPRLKLFTLFSRRFVIAVWALLTVLLIAANYRAYAQQPPTTPAPAASAPAPDAPKADPGGVNTGDRTNAANASSAAAFSADDLKKLSDAKDKPASNADLLKVLDTVGQGHIGINFVWTLVTGFLVMFMQVGFAMVETGFCRAKNAAHTMMMNILVYPVGMLGWWIAGFAIMFGTLAASKIGGPPSLGGLPTLNGHEFSVGGFGLCALPVPTCVHGHGRDDPDRCHG
jgi:Amt family ammonium transporter